MKNLSDFIRRRGAQALIMIVVSSILIASAVFGAQNNPPTGGTTMPLPPTMTLAPANEPTSTAWPTFPPRPTATLGPRAAATTGTPTPQVDKPFGDYSNFSDLWSRFVQW